MQGTRDTENDSPLGVTVSSGLLCPHCPCPHWPPTMLWQAEFLNLPVSTKSMLSQSCLCGRDRDYSLNDIVGPLTTPTVFRLRESRVDQSPDITGTRTETFTSHRAKEYWNLIAIWLTGELEVVLGRLCLGKKKTEQPSEHGCGLSSAREGAKCLGREWGHPWEVSWPEITKSSSEWCARNRKERKAMEVGMAGCKILIFEYSDFWTEDVTQRLSACLVCGRPWVIPSTTKQAN